MPATNMTTTTKTANERRGDAIPAPAQPRADVQLHLEVRDLLVALFEFAVRPSRRITDLVTVYRRRAYYLAYTIIGVSCMSGPFTYYYFWGHKYFNAWYLALGPLLVLGTFVFVLSVFHLGVYFLWGNRGFFARKLEYLKHLYLWMAFTPLAWLFDPLRAVWPGENPVVWMSLPIAGYFGWRVTRRGEKSFRNGRSLALGSMLAGVPYFAILFYYPALSKMLVRWLAL